MSIIRFCRKVSQTRKMASDRVKLYLLIISLQIVIIESMTFSDTCKTILKYSFERHHCLYYLTEDSPLTSNIHECLSLRSIPTVVITRQNIRHYDQNLQCNGYVIVSESLNYLQELFSRKNRFEFETHKRIVIFFSGRANFFVPPFVTAVFTKGNDIIVVEGSPETSHESNLTFFGSSEFKLNKVVSLSKNKTLAAVNDRGEYEITREDFYSPDWYPNFQVWNRSLKVATFNCSPFVYVNSEGNVYDGLDFRILMEITGNAWPLEYNIQNYSREKSQYYLVFRSVEDDVSDIGMCSVFWSQATVFKLEAAYPYAQICETFLVPRPHLLSETLYVYQPIHRNLWIIIIVAIFIIALTLNTFAKYDLDRQNIIKMYSNYANCLMHIIRMISLGSLEIFPSSAQATLRITLISWSITSLVLATGYSAGFSSILMYPRYTTQIKTLQDMIDRKIFWGFQNINSTKGFVVDFTSPTLLKLLENVKISSDVPTRDKDIRENNYAVSVKIISQSFVAYTDDLDEYGQTHLVLLNECFMLNSIMFALPKNSPLKKIFDERIIALSEHGIINYWHDYTVRKHSRSYMRNFFVVYPLRMDAFALNARNLQGVFYLLLAGQIISFVVFLGEIYIYQTSVVQDRGVIRN